MLTTAFEAAAHMRAKTLGLGGHPLVVIPHPLASKTEAEVKVIAADMVDSIVRVLTERP
jgi:hypothetical protein